MEILGVDIGGTGIKGAIVDTETGELITQRIRLLTPQPATPEAVASVLKELVVQTGFKGPVACGFPARITNGTVKTAANIDKSWIDVPVEELFTRELTCDTKVSVVNDADAAGLAELEFGAARGVNGKVIFLTLGTGIGSALFVDGIMFEGTELGHLKFKKDVAEHYCSAVVREREDLSWNKWGKRLGKYLNYVNFLFEPELFIIGGGVSAKFDRFKEELTQDLKIVPAAFLNQAGIIGAAMYGERRLR